MYFLIQKIINQNFFEKKLLYVPIIHKRKALRCWMWCILRWLKLWISCPFSVT